MMHTFKLVKSLIAAVIMMASLGCAYGQYKPPVKGGVSRIIAGTNVSISPSGGTGAVTVNATGSSFTYGNATLSPSVTIPSGGASTTIFTQSLPAGTYLFDVDTEFLATGGSGGTGFDLQVAGVDTYTTDVTHQSTNWLMPVHLGGVITLATTGNVIFRASSSLGGVVEATGSAYSSAATNWRWLKVQ